MAHNVVRRASAPFLLTAALAGFLHADVRLPALISDHMLLQQGVPVRIWGSATPGEAVRVSFRGQEAATVAAADGRWSVWLRPMNPGQPAELTVAGANSITIRDVLVGEVWVGSGQSNMGMTVARSNNAEEEIAKSANPSIRLFDVKRTVADQPLSEVVGSWMICGPETVRNFSAAAYFFARDLYSARRVPVGMIHSSWGGTPVQAWTARSATEAEPALRWILEDWQRTLDEYPGARARYEKTLAGWKPNSGTPKPYPPIGPGDPHAPFVLYNGMIAPLTPYAIRGVIWYQGENNASERQAYIYRRMFRTMIEDWRRAWGQGDFPFLFVQLANFDTNPFWPTLRESQTDALSLRNTGMAVAIDIGESKDIHPRNKQEVGRRLALAARHVAYGEALVYSGPLFRQLTTEGGRLRVWFDHAEGLAAKGGGPVTGFAVAGEDGNYVPAEARIDGDAVLVSSPQVAKPVSVRYAWAADPVCNLVNGEGLPASPFRAGERLR